MTFVIAMSRRGVGWWSWEGRREVRDEREREERVTF